MNFQGDRERKSKVYLPNVQSIAMNKDSEHQKISPAEVQETKQIQEKKQIDKIMLGVVKERLFGTFMNQDNKFTEQNFYNVDYILKNSQTYRHSRLRSQYSKDITTLEQSIELTKHRRGDCGREHYLTIDTHRSAQHNLDNLEKSRNKRSFSKNLPKIVTKVSERLSPLKKLQMQHQKKLDINEKICGQKFKKWAGGNIGILTMYDIKISRQTIINSYKDIVDVNLLERFFHFFNFPQSFGLRHYCNLVENAVNCNMKFIYFWVFGLFDENGNGLLQSQDLFRFLQRFPVENNYIEQQIYRIERYLLKIKQNFKPREEKQLVEQTLIVNHNLKLDELKDLMKQSEKQRLDVDCVKNTCYHQTMMSIEHDVNEREKIIKIQSNQLQTRKLKQEMLEIKKKLQNTPGLRLRDFYAIFGNTKRPRIFCYFISLLTGEKGSNYE